MHPGVTLVIEKVGDQLSYPDYTYVRSLLLLLAEQVFPHQVPPYFEGFDADVQEYGWVRRAYSQIGIEIAVDDYFEPKPDVLRVWLDDISKYAAFRDTQRHDRDSIVNQCLSQVGTSSKLTKKKQRLQFELEQFDKHLELDRAEYTERRLKYQELKTRTKEQTEALTQLFAERAADIEQIGALETEIKDMTKKCEKLQQQIAALEPHIDLETGQAIVVTTQISTLRDRIHRLKNAKANLDRQLVDTRAANTTLTKVLATIPNLASYCNRYTQVLADRNEHGFKNIELKADRRRLSTELSSITKQLEETIAKINAAKQQETYYCKELEKVNADWEAKQAQTESEDAELEAEIDELKVSIRTTRSEIERERDLNQQATGLLSAMSKRLRDASDELSVSKGELDEVMHKLQKLAN